MAYIILKIRKLRSQINMRLDNCNVCGKRDKLYVAASTMGPCSYAYCEECLSKGLEPYSAMVDYISCAGYFPQDVNEIYQKHCRHILKELNISEEKFIADVAAAVDDDYGV